MNSRLAKSNFFARSSIHEADSASENQYGRPRAYSMMELAKPRSKCSSCSVKRIRSSRFTTLGTLRIKPPPPQAN